MKTAPTLALAVLSIAAASACSSPKVMVPPRIDLQDHEVLAIIEFSSSSQGQLGPLTTTRFMEWVRIDQGLLRIIELGTEQEALSEVGSARLDRAAYQELGRTHEVATIFTGEVVVSDIRPAVSISADLRNIGAAADVDATLTVQMVETASGASIWSRSAEVTQRVGHVSLIGGDISFDADDPERAYGDLVDALLELVTREFRVTWERQ
jgi:hypothetical protein